MVPPILPKFPFYFCDTLAYDPREYLEVERSSVVLTIVLIPVLYYRKLYLSYYVVLEPYPSQFLRTEARNLHTKLLDVVILYDKSRRWFARDTIVVGSG